ncbi:protein NUCLEAR FUSION DEFECTIVE 4-like isoform X2 [Phalaenopsis equestris]|uniref:protein NUCLEAR FUSION DEFECTIVE 4-like isoform X2 n=1 Tax=Phalaenopsis equestris TaxID=78828 RepID=UPI0009E1DCBB|nr:protein NUCLEAR FUSION DEFECTIVE 4-like isoform X2 [Phalaenopsis equestris]
MNSFQSPPCSFFNNRWLVFVGAIWVQSVAGVGYLFGGISPVIKVYMGYNQRQIAALGVAKDLGGSVGFPAGILCEFLPLWSVLFIGALKKVMGYGWIWLIITGRVSVLPLWAMCILLFVGNNGETYFNTTALVSCLQNFPNSRGPIVGILKGFAGLSGAILIQIYTVIRSPDDAALIFMVAVGPSIVVIALMFIIRPVAVPKQVQPSDNSSFAFIYSLCLLLAAYLMATMLLQDLVNLSHNFIIMFTVALIILLLSPITIPLIITFGSHAASSDRKGLLSESQREEPDELMVCEVEVEKSDEVDLLPESKRMMMNQQVQAELFQAAPVGAVRVQSRRGLNRGENFTLCQAFIEADFWLLFISLLLGSGSGLTVMDNLGQMSQSLGYDKPHIFVSLISIWNFLGRVVGGYLSEIIVRDHAYPRPLALAVSQGVMAVGHFFIGMGLPGSLYVGTLVIGLGFGAHWAIAPAAASELFASRKAHMRQKHGDRLEEEGLRCEGAICFFYSSMIMSGFSIIAVILSLVLVYRTKVFYSNRYEKNSSLSCL